LRDIYARIADEIGLDAEIGMNCELEVEESLFFSNPYMKYVFDTIKAQGKRIILVSDMYISANELQRMITKCGYIGYEKMFVSCDYSCSKRDGKLYYIVNKYLNDDDIKVIHVGDNAVSDIKMADKYGMATYLYENVNAKGKEYRPTDMSLLVGGAYRGIVNSHIHNGYKRYDAYYEYGFTYGGLFMLGYAQYIHRYALEHKIDKVLFVARDGYIIKKVYDMFFSDIKSEYMLCSRISNLKMAAYCSKNDFLKEFVLRWDKEKKNISIRDVLENMDLLDMIEMLPVFVNVEDSMDEENTKIIYKFICDNWNYVINKYEKYINLSYKYYRNFLERTRRVLVVDIGWRGQGILALRNLERDYWHFGCEIYGMLAGSAPTKVCTGQLQAGIIDTYMFSPIKNIVSFSFHSKNAINNILTELFAGAPSPSFKGFIEEGDDYSLAFDVPEIANYELISKIHEGIVDFVKMYAGCFESYDFMYEISGEDAYMPIKHIFKDYSFIKRFLGKYEFQDCVGGTSGESLRKVSDVFKKFNL